MADVVFVGLIVVLFAASAALVKACERIVGGADAEVSDTTAGEPEPLERAA